MIIGSDYIYVEATESTNTFASDLIRSGEIREGTIIHAGFQSAGRGQKGNRWDSENGKNLLFSIILYPSTVKADEQFIISMVISLGILDFLKIHIPAGKIKWPNDIYAADDKIAGILIENSVFENTIRNSVAGIGLNINQTNFPEHIPNPVSLKMLTGREYDLTSCLKELSAHLDRRYKQLIAGEISRIRDEYISSLYRLDEWHEFSTSTGKFSGRIVNVDNFGRLIIEAGDKKIFRFNFTEVDFIY